MKKILFSFGLASLLFVGCGSDEDSKDENTPQTINEESDSVKRYKLKTININNEGDHDKTTYNFNYENGKLSKITVEHTRDDDESSWFYSVSYPSQKTVIVTYSDHEWEQQINLNLNNNVVSKAEASNDYYDEITTTTETYDYYENKLTSIYSVRCWSGESVGEHIDEYFLDWGNGNITSKKRNYGSTHEYYYTSNNNNTNCDFALLLEVEDEELNTELNMLICMKQFIGNISNRIPTSIVNSGRTREINTVYDEKDRPIKMTVASDVDYESAITYTFGYYD